MFGRLYEALLTPPVSLPDREVAASLLASEASEAQDAPDESAEDAPEAQESTDDAEASVGAGSARAEAALVLADQARVSAASLNDFILQADRATLEARGVRVRPGADAGGTPAHLQTRDAGGAPSGVGGGASAGVGGGGGSASDDGGATGRGGAPDVSGSREGRGTASGGSETADRAATGAPRAGETGASSGATPAALAGLAGRLGARVPVAAGVTPVARVAPGAAPAASSNAIRVTSGTAPAPGAERPSSGRTVRVTPEQRANVEQQIARGIGAMARQRGGVVTLRLAPDALGSVDVRVTMRGGGLEARFESQNESARALLESSMDRLRESLEARGLRVDRLDVRAAPALPAVAESGRSGTGESRHSEDPRSRRRGRSEPGPSEDGSRETDPFRFGLELGLDTIG